jgi:ferritin-like protein
MNSKATLLDRRRALQGMAAVGAGTMLLPVARQIRPASAARQATPEAAELTDEAIMTFVLNLEYLEAEYYLRGTTGDGIGPDDVGADPGAVTGGSAVPFATEAYRQFAEELAANELAHVRYYRAALGDEAVDRPTIDLAAGFAAVGEAAGFGADWDPFANELDFLLGGMLFEDVGVTGYKAATPLITDKALQEDIAGVLAVEAYHMGMARSHLFLAGATAQQAANAITAARGTLNGEPDIEQGIEVDGQANFVPSDERGIAFSRTPQQVLQIVYLTPDTGVSSGGFFPDGVNGDLAST